MRSLPTLLLAALAAFTLTGVAEAQGRGPGGGPSGGSGGGPSARPGGGGHGGSGGGHRRRGHNAKKKKGKKGGQQLFQRLDTDGDGKISAAEAAAAGRHAAKIMAADADGDGFVTKDEWKAHQQAQAFKRLDKDGNGYLEGRELRRAGRRLRGADTDGDGKISQQEFNDFLAAKAAKASGRQNVRQAFQAADANGDHKLDSSEWPSGASATFSDVDANGDGEVTGREIGAYMQANNGQSPL